jgi:DNA-binding NarL/FixJ family response regulator
MASIVLLHSDPAIARRLRAVIETQEGLQVTGIADSVPALRDLLSGGAPDLLIVDLLLPAADVRSLLKGLRGNGQFGRPLVLALAVSVDDARLMDALRHGADAYFAQARSPISLLATILQALNGESSMAPQIARHVKSHFEAASWDETDFVGESQNPLRLSETDQLLLQWTAEGYLVNEVARGLQLSPRGVGVRIRNIYRKLQFDLRAAGLSLQAA